MGVTNNNKISNNKLCKASLGECFKFTKKLGLSLVLINCLSISVASAAAKTELVNIFLSDSGSLILETKDKQNLEDFELLKSGEKSYKLVLNDSKVSSKLIKDFNNTHTNYKIKNETVKESLFKKQNKVSIDVECLSNCAAGFEPLLGGLAYKLNLDTSAPHLVKAQTKTKGLIKKRDGFQAVEQNIIKEPELIAIADSNNLDIEIEDKDFELPVTIEKPLLNTTAALEPVKSMHLLKANKKDKFLFALTKESSPVEEFIDDLDSSVADQLLSNDDFQTENIAKADSASLSYIAQKLSNDGHQALSANAYAKALEVDPENLNAMLGLARTTKNEDEKLHYYLKAVDDQALLSIGQKWFAKGISSGDSQKIAQAMVSYQFAVLKNPTNPYYRFEYAQALEESGFSNFEQASKRYLEAAVLAKKDFVAGDIQKENILRKSTECLIKVLTKKGAPDKAVHYCNSYLGLGFKKFLDGRSIKGVMKEISSNKNPFQA